MFTTSDSNEHLLKNSISTYAMSSLQEIFRRNQHCSRIRKIQSILISFYNDTFQHSILTMYQAITKCFSQGLVSESFVLSHISNQFERSRQGLRQLWINPGIKLKYIRYPSTIRINPISISYSWIVAEFLPIVNKVMRYGIPDCQFISKHQERSKGKAFLTCLPIHFIAFYPFQEFHIIQIIPWMSFMP